MARPNRNNVDYFPFLCKEGKSIYYIEHKYGNDGYATWIKIIRTIAITDFHFLNLKNETEIMYLSAKCKITEILLIEIITDLTNLGEFDADLWNDHRIIYSPKFIDNIQDAYDRRNTKCIDYNSLITYLKNFEIIK